MSTRSLVAAAALSLFALPSTAAAFCDDAATIAVPDGVRGAAEYPGHVAGVGSGFGGYLGAPAQLYLDSDATGALALALDSTGGNCTPSSDDTIVFYLDAVPGAGFADTAGFTDHADAGRAAVSGMGTDGARAALTFPAGFAPESAIVVRNDFVGLFRLVSGGSHVFVRALDTHAGFATSCVKEMAGVSLSDLGSQRGNPVRVLGTLLNASNAYRANEFIGATAPATNIEVQPHTITGGTGAHFLSFGPPVGLSGPFAFLDFEEYAGTGFTPSPACGRLSSLQFAATGVGDGDLAFGGASTSGNAARGLTSTSVTSGGLYAFDLGGERGRTFGVQPTGAAFEPGTITLRFENRSTLPLVEAAIGLVVSYRNDQGRSTSLTFSWSSNGTDFTALPAAFGLVTPEAADTAGWVSAARAGTLTGFSIAPGGYLYLRASLAASGGSGGRDELAIDDVVVRPTFVTCGNGMLDAGEACDTGPLNGTTPCGCQLGCTYAALDVACGGGGADVCDAADTCDGAGHCVDRVASAGTVCAVAAPGASCDADDLCDGTTAVCAPRFASAGAVCRASAGVCDQVEVCTGTGAACPGDSFEAAGVSCRAAAGTCDVGEVCTGSGADCPADAFAAVGVSCRAASDLCDVPEFCSGIAATCPADGVAAAGLDCRPQMSACDIEEVCDGVAASCPADALDPSCDCSLDTDCGDGSACTTDSCVRPAGSPVGRCSNTPVADCCDADADCADTDGSACTVPTCDLTAHRCAEVARVCDDGDVCTTDACNAGSGACQYTAVAGCGVDAGMIGEDAGVVGDDAGMLDDDAGVVGDDAGTLDDDAGVVGDDAGTMELPDVGIFDGGARDAGARDGGRADGGPDAGEGPDAGAGGVAGGCGCRAGGAGSGAASSSLALLLGLALVVRRRARR